MTLLTRIPLYPLLFAAYAVLFLYAANLALVLPVDAAAPLARAVTVAGMLWAVAAVILRDWRRGAIVATAAVVAFFAYGHVSGGLSARGLDDRAQLALWGLVFVAALVYAIRARGSLPSVTAGLNVFAIVLIVFAGTSIVPYELGRAGRAPVALAPAVLANATTRTDARHLLPDLRPLRVGGVDRPPVRDHGQRPVRLAARARASRCPPHSHANYRATDFSLAATLNMRYLDELTTDDRPRLGRPDASPGDVQGPRGRRVPQGGGLPLLPARLVVRADRGRSRSRTRTSSSASRASSRRSSATRRCVPAIDRVLGRRRRPS